MKQIITCSVLVIVLFIGCQKSDGVNTFLEAEVIPSQISQRTCASSDLLAGLLANDPKLNARREALENFTRNAIADGSLDKIAGSGITIPVVVNVVYNTNAENITDAQIESQIDVLNEDFNKRNADVSSVPAIYKKSIGDVGVNFVLSSVVRRQSNKKSWINDAVKKTSNGGIDPTDPEHKLNMWVCNLGRNLLGYAYYPGTVPASIDGVVVLYSAFGSRQKFPGGSYIQYYDLGRTATHEVGHWLNLAHIWGDDGGSCAGSDFVDDTPNQADENYGCPSFPTVSCSNTSDMFMNYMDYTDDKCMFMFSKGQGSRSLAVLAPGGPRAGYVMP